MVCPVVELVAAQRELAAAQSYFECAESGQVDEAIYRVRAAEERMNNIFASAKSEAGGERRNDG